MIQHLFFENNRLALYLSILCRSQLARIVKQRKTKTITSSARAPTSKHNYLVYTYQIK